MFKWLSKILGNSDDSESFYTSLVKDTSTSFPIKRDSSPKIENAVPPSEPSTDSSAAIQPAKAEATPVLKSSAIPAPPIPAPSVKKTVSNSEKRNNIIRAVLLTKSGKGGGACVAGYDLLTKRFVRFVSDGEAAAEIPFTDLRDISEFDIVEAENLGCYPIGAQTENVLIKRYGIKKVGKFSETIEDIRGNIKYKDGMSFLDAKANRLFSVDGFKHSLEIVKVSNLELRKYKKSNGSFTTRANFIYNNVRYYDFRVTDFNFDMRKQEQATKKIAAADLVLSIPKEPYYINGDNLGYFIFIAAIFPIEDPKICQIPPSGAEKKDPGPLTNSYSPWTELEEETLKAEFYGKMTIKEIAAAHKRSDGAIRSRLKKLGLID